MEAGAQAAGDPEAAGSRDAREDPGPWLVDPAEAAREVDEIFERFDSPETPGCAAAASRKGQPLLSRAYGMADLEHSIPNTPASLFEAGSVSKQFTATAAVLLHLDGELDLDDDVRDYLPRVPDYGETITIRHLITHTSGLRDWGSVAAISGWGRSERSHRHEHVLEIIERQSEINFPPGTRYSYSNSGYNLLAMLVEEVSGRSLEAFTRDRIFEPLAMTNTQWRSDYRRIVPGRSTAYSQLGDRRFEIDRPIEHVYGNAALLTTVGDLLLWNRALATGEALGDDFTRLMHEPGVLRDGNEIHYAMGLQLLESLGRPVVQHTGATSGYRAYLARFPGNELSVAVLCNVASANPGALGEAVAAVLLGAEEDEEETPEGIDLPGETLESLTGPYRSTLNQDHMRIILDQGTLKVENGADLIPLSESEFHEAGTGRLFRFGSEEGQARGDLRVVVAQGYQEERFVEEQPFDPSEEELEAFTGLYESEDARTGLDVRLEDGRLTARRPVADPLTLEPIYRDGFQAPEFGILRFLRDEEGEVTDVVHSRGRVYGMVFVRVDE